MAAPARRGRPFPADEPESGGLGRFLADHRAGIGGLAVAIAAGVIGWLAWSRVADSVRAHPETVLLPGAIELRGKAPWVRCDLKAEALRNASLDGGLPLDDPELPRKLAGAFDMHPWVRRVIDVRLAHPASAVVEIACREPVAMVAVKGGLLAIDAEGIVLPSADFTSESAAAYPRIAGVESSPQGPEGSAWGDPVVEDAAALAVAIGPEWKLLGLVECRPVGKHGLRRWELVGPGQRTILFGSAPGREASGEPVAAAKIARLRLTAADPAASAEQRIDLVEETAAAATESIPSIPAP